MSLRSTVPGVGSHGDLHERLFGQESSIFSGENHYWTELMMADMKGFEAFNRTQSGHHQQTFASEGRACLTRLDSTVVTYFRPS